MSARHRVKPVISATDQKVEAPRLVGGDPTLGQLRTLAAEAYAYGFPLVDHYRQLHAAFIDREHPAFEGSWNSFHHGQCEFSPDDHSVRLPDCDMASSVLGLDLRREPLVLTVPSFGKNRHFSLEFTDLHTFVFAHIGSRATGPDGGRFLITGPYWRGLPPPGIQSIIACDTELASVRLKIQIFGPEDVQSVQTLQARFHVEPLSMYVGKPPPPAPAMEFLKPLSARDERMSLEFFEELNFVLGLSPPHPAEREINYKLGALNIGRDRRFDPWSLTAEQRLAIEDGMTDAWKAHDEAAKRRPDAEPALTRAEVDEDWLKRMVNATRLRHEAAREESLFFLYSTDSERVRLDGSHHRYLLHFQPGQLPPVKSFWSLTLYDLPSQALARNDRERYVINSVTTPDLKRDANGGLTVYIQRVPPAPEREANWLPAPTGPFLLALRLYWPQRTALNGHWAPPPLDRRLNGSD